MLAAKEVAASDEPAAPAPTVTVTVLADVTVTVAGPHAPAPEAPSVGASPFTAEADAAPAEMAALLVTGVGETVTVEYSGRAPVPVGASEVALTEPYGAVGPPVGWMGAPVG